MMNIIIIEHAAHENPGIILDWISDNDYNLKTVKPFAGDSLEFDDAFDFLIIMGGPQSPRDIDIYPYLKDEIKFIKKAIKNNKLVLGICLGAQLIGEALGTGTRHSTHREYGFYPVVFSDYALKLKAFNNFPKSIICLHWHNDMPGINDSLKPLAESEGCPVQGIIYDERVIGLQFHMEIRRKDIHGLIDFDIDTLNKSEMYIMKSEEIMKNDFERMNLYMKKFLDNFVS